MAKAINEYAKYPTIREMHRSDNAAGRTHEIAVGEDGRTTIMAHIVDLNAVAKVKARIYAGFKKRL